MKGEAKKEGSRQLLNCRIRSNGQLLTIVPRVNGCQGVGMFLGEVCKLPHQLPSLRAGYVSPWALQRSPSGPDCFVDILGASGMDLDDFLLVAARMSA